MEYDKSWVENEIKRIIDDIDTIYRHLNMNLNNAIAEHNKDDEIYFEDIINELNDATDILHGAYTLV